MNSARIVSRAWYYFRMGYSTYLTFLLGYISTFITIYYLAIKSIPYLVDIFPHFLTFMLLGTVIGVPFSVFLGWLHLKKTSAWSAEQDISSEANPYYYKLLPGYWQEAFVPFYLELLRQNRKILASSKLLSSEDEARISELEKKLETLISGGYVGQPRRRRWVEASERH